MTLRTWSVNCETTIKLLAASRPKPLVGMGSPMSMYHLVGSGMKPSGPKIGNVGEIGKYGKPVSFASRSDFASEIYVYSAPTTDTGMSGAPVLRAMRTKPPRPKRARW